MNHSNHTDRLAVSKRTALKMYWEAGFDSESLLLLADKSLSTLPREGDYFYADDVSRAIALDIQATTPGRFPA